MPSVSGGLSGAASGAQIGAAGGPIGMAVGAGVGGLIGLFGSGKSPQQKTAEKLLTNLKPVQDNLVHWSGQANDQRKLLQGVSAADLMRAAGFYRDVLSDSDTTALNRLVGPQRQGINAGYENLKTNAARFGPRGGGRTSGLMNLEFQKNQEIMNLVPQARLQAAAGLAGVGGQEQSGAIGFGNLALQNSLGVADMARAGFGAPAGASGLGQVGSQLGTILGPYLSDILAKLGKKGAPTGGVSSGEGGGSLEF